MRIHPTMVDLIRFLAFLLVVAAVTYGYQLDLDIRGEKGHLFSEASYLEAAQITALALMLLLLALCPPGDRQGTIRWSLMALMAGLMVREMDYYLDRMVFDGAWQTMVTAILIALMVYLVPRREAFYRDLTDFIASRPAGLFIGGILALAFSRVFGVKDLWMGIMGADFIRSVKNAAEEGVEMFAYLLLVFAMTEFLIERRRANASRRQSAEHPSGQVAKGLD